MARSIRDMVILFVLVLFTFLIAGCSEKVICAEPNVLIDNVCCLDSDHDGICDPAQVVEEVEPVEQVELEVDNSAEIFADTFAKTWSSKSYTALYSLFEADYRFKFSPQEFNFIARKLDSANGVSRVRLQKVEDGAAFYIVEDSTGDNFVVAELVDEDGDYKHKSFYFFTELDAESACGDDPDCYFSIAKITRNNQYCEKTGELRLDCLEELGMSRSLASRLQECVTIKDYYVKVECLEELAVDENSPEPCWEAEYDKQTYMCLGLVASKRGDPAECDDLVKSNGFASNKQQHAYCILGYVKDSNDADACELIDRRDNVVVGAMQEGCYNGNYA